MAFGIPNLENQLSLFLEGGTGITTQRVVEFDKRYLWVVDFVNVGTSSLAPNPPFDTFFPASDVNIPVASLNTENLVFGQTEISRPANESARELSITFYDDDNRTLLKYFFDWINLDIKNNGAFLSGLKDDHDAVAPDSFGVRRLVYPTRQLRLTLLDAYRTEKTVFNYRVFPKDTIDFSGSQVSEAQTYTVNFAIVDDLTYKPAGSSVGGFSFQTVLNALGRFI